MMRIQPPASIDAVVRSTQYSPVQSSTAQHSTAQHSTTQRSTGQHSTVQGVVAGVHSTAAALQRRSVARRHGPVALAAPPQVPLAALVVSGGPAVTVAAASSSSSGAVRSPQWGGGLVGSLNRGGRARGRRAGPRRRVSRRARSPHFLGTDFSLRACRGNCECESARGVSRCVNIQTARVCFGRGNGARARRYARDTSAGVVPEHGRPVSVVEQHDHDGLPRHSHRQRGPGQHGQR